MNGEIETLHSNERRLMMVIHLTLTRAEDGEVRVAEAAAWPGQGPNCTLHVRFRRSTGTIHVATVVIPPQHVVLTYRKLVREFQSNSEHQ